MGGFSDGGAGTDQVFRYDNNLGVWTPRARMPFPTSNHCAVYFQPENRVYVFGGELEIPYDYVQIYDVGRDSWSYRFMPHADYGMSAAVLDDSIYVAFGAEHPGLFFRYHPNTDDWAPRARSPDSAHNGAMCSLDGKIYYAGGWDSLKVFRRYDPGNNVWTRLPDLPQGRHGLGLIALAGHIYMVGGGQRWNTGADCRDVYVFDPDSNCWHYDSRTHDLHIAGAYGTYTYSPNAYLFAVCGYSTNACEVGHRLVAGIGSGSSDHLRPRALNTYPNPFRMQTTISLQPGISTSRELRIYSAAGRMVNSFLFPGLPGSSFPPLVWSGCDSTGFSLPAGTYILTYGRERLTVCRLD